MFLKLYKYILLFAIIFTSANLYAKGISTQQCEKYMKPIDFGFWIDKNKYNTRKIQGYIDFELNNYAFHKLAVVHLHIERENNSVEHFTYRLNYKGQLANGKEKWGTDNIVFYPDSNWHGKFTNIKISYNILANTDSDFFREAVFSEKLYQLATYNDLSDLKTDTNISIGGLGRPDEAEDNLYAEKYWIDTTNLTSDLKKFNTELPQMEVCFSPYNNTEQTVIREIDNVIKTKKADPQGYHYIHMSFYKVDDTRIVNKIIEAHKNGVDIKILTDSSQLNPYRSYLNGYKKLVWAGVPVVGITRTGFAAANHTKIINYDGKLASSGSYNLGFESADDNAENMILFHSKEMAQVYEEIYRAVAGFGDITYQIDSASKLKVYYSQLHNVPYEIYNQLEQANDEIIVTMFTLRHLHFWHNGQRKDLLDALIRAKDRGVDVKVLLEVNIADQGEYYGKITPDDPTDEWLSKHGIKVTKIHASYTENKYASMHHKYAVIDRKILLTGSSNWFSATQVSDDDLIVIKDKSIALKYVGEYLNLRKLWDKDFDESKYPKTIVEFSVYTDKTTWGDKVYVTGNIEELGKWDLNKAIELKAIDWPTWKTNLKITSGTYFKYKYLIKNHNGSFYEYGNNRQKVVDINVEKQKISDYFNH